MSAKRKTIQSKHSQDRREAEKYLWHLCPPWRDKFKHDHWWKPPPSKVELEAVIWEILRRHPRAEQLLAKRELFQDSPEIDFFISQSGTSSWPMLSKKKKKAWIKRISIELRPQHGFFGNNLSEAVEVIADGRIGFHGKKFWDSMAADATQPYAFDEMERAKKIWNDSTPRKGIFGGGINFDAFKCLTLGRVLVGFDPNYPGVEKLVQMKVKELVSRAKIQSHKHNTPGRSYWAEWLEVIGNFEKEELKREPTVIRDDQLFKRYRGFIRQWQWPS
jgi:hypothetical protein